jgi:hypothetical protein
MYTTDPFLDAEAEAATYSPPPFPTWPPPSGGAPVVNPEQGPILNPYPYGSTQGANINTANPAPPFSAMAYPHKMTPGTNGQNQGSSNALPPMTKSMEGGPALANPFYSQIQPPPILGPGAQGTPPY